MLKWGIPPIALGFVIALPPLESGAVAPPQGQSEPRAKASRQMTTGNIAIKRGSVPKSPVLVVTASNASSDKPAHACKCATVVNSAAMSRVWVNARHCITERPLPHLIRASEKALNSDISQTWAKMARW